jgi:hypothetical protein
MLSVAATAAMSLKTGPFIYSCMDAINNRMILEEKPGACFVRGNMVDETTLFQNIESWDKTVATVTCTEDSITLQSNRNDILTVKVVIQFADAGLEKGTATIDWSEHVILGREGHLAWHTNVERFDHFTKFVCNGLGYQVAKRITLL